MLSLLYGDSSLGHYSYIQSGIFINVHIGRYCSIAPGVSLGNYFHPTDWLSTSPFQYEQGFHDLNTNIRSYYDKRHEAPHVIIGNDVWLGANVIIFPGLKIGHGAIIGAGAIVTKDVPPYAVALGSPARIVRYRFDEETITQLLELSWWDMDPRDMDGVEFDEIHKAIGQIREIKKRLGK